MHISRRTHGYLDYLVGALLIAAPWLFGFASGGIEQQIPIIVGIVTLVYSALTRYELGVIKVVPFGAHLTMDVISGIFLALSPWLFQFADRVWIPHVLVGAFEIVAVMMTERTTAAERQPPPGAPAHL